MYTTISINTGFVANVLKSINLITLTSKFQLCKEHQGDTNWQRKTIEADKDDNSPKSLSTSTSYNTHSNTLQHTNKQHSLSTSTLYNTHSNTLQHTNKQHRLSTSTSYNTHSNTLQHTNKQPVCRPVPRTMLTPTLYYIPTNNQFVDQYLVQYSLQHPKTHQKAT